MASARLPLDSSMAVGGAVLDAMGYFDVFRQKLAGLNAQLNGAAGYAGDTTAIAAAMFSGATTAQATTLLNLVAQANGELIGTATTQINVGATTGSRQLGDACGRNR